MNKTINISDIYNDLRKIKIIFEDENRLIRNDKEYNYIKDLLKIAASNDTFLNIVETRLSIKTLMKKCIEYTDVQNIKNITFDINLN